MHHYKGAYEGLEVVPAPLQATICGRLAANAVLKRMHDKRCTTSVLDAAKSFSRKLSLGGAPLQGGSREGSKSCMHHFQPRATSPPPSGSMTKEIDPRKGSVTILVGHWNCSIPLSC